MDNDELNEITPNQRRALSKGLAALETMAGLWAAEIRLSEMSVRLAEAAAEQRPARIAAFIEQAFIEGAYRHFLDHRDGKTPEASERATEAKPSASAAPGIELPTPHWARDLHGETEVYTKDDLRAAIAAAREEERQQQLVRIRHLEHERDSARADLRARLAAPEGDKPFPYLVQPPSYSPTYRTQPQAKAQEQPPQTEGMLPAGEARITPEFVAKALEALDSMDDYARMESGVSATGPVNLLKSFIETAAIVHQLK